MENRERRNTKPVYNGSTVEQEIKVTSVTFIKRYIHVLPSGRRLKIMVSDESEVARLIHP